MSSNSLTLQLITVSIITLQRELIHLQITRRNSWNNNYDYIVIGGGTAGSVVASRLSEDNDRSVLVLEAGGPQSVITDMASEALTLLGGECDWDYTSVPQRLSGIYFKVGGKR